MDTCITVIQYLVDLSQLNSQAPDLYLIICTADKLEIAITQHSHNIAALVEPLTASDHKSLLSELRSAKVTSG